MAPISIVGLCCRQASRFTLTHVDMDSTQTEVKAMEDLRDEVENIFPDDLAFPYSQFYLGWETNKVCEPFPLTTTNSTNFLRSGKLLFYFA